MRTTPGQTALTLMLCGASSLSIEASVALASLESISQSVFQVHGAALSFLAKAMAMFDHESALLEEEGTVLTGPRGGAVPNPRVMVVTSLRASILRYEARLHFDVEPAPLPVSISVNSAIKAMPSLSANRATAVR